MSNTKPKIQVPWAEEESEVQKMKELKTRQYWRVSRIWNGFGNPITVHNAINQLNNVLCNLDTQRPLAQRASSLLNLVVTHGSKPKQRKKQKNVELKRMTIL